MEEGQMLKMRFFGSLIGLILILSMSTSAAMANVIVLPTEKALPGADFDQFPVELRRLSAIRQADLGLHPIRLQSAWCGLNWMGKRQAFEFQCLEAGIIVLADQGGVVRYKEDCGNRLVAIPKQAGAACHDCEVACLDCQRLDAKPSLSPAKAGFDWARFLRLLEGALLGILLALLILLAIWLGLVLLRVVRQYPRLFSGVLTTQAEIGNEPPTPKPVPVVPPQPPAPVPALVPAPPVPNVDNGGRRHGQRRTNGDRRTVA